jgi:hypothetical protein
MSTPGLIPAPTMPGESRGGLERGQVGAKWTFPSLASPKTGGTGACRVHHLDPQSATRCRWLHRAAGLVPIAPPTCRQSLCAIASRRVRGPGDPQSATRRRPRSTVSGWGCPCDPHMVRNVPLFHLRREFFPLSSRSDAACRSAIRGRGLRVARWASMEGRYAREAIRGSCRDRGCRSLSRMVPELGCRSLSGRCRSWAADPFPGWCRSWAAIRMIRPALSRASAALGRRRVSRGGPFP